MRLVSFRLYRWWKERHRRSLDRYAEMVTSSERRSIATSTALELGLLALPTPHATPLLTDSALIASARDDEREDKGDADEQECPDSDKRPREDFIRASVLGPGGEPNAVAPQHNPARARATPFSRRRLVAVSAQGFERLRRLR
jgi:hypothetical protein